jgi:signal transduction histidine kinase
LIFVVILAFTLGYFYKYQKNKNKQIKKQNKNLEEVNNFKSKLITIIAHDLRRPYANMIGTLQLIRSGDLDTEEQHLLFEQIEKQTVQTNEFIHKLLLWAKSQTEGFKFNPIMFDVNVVINSVVQVLIQDAERKQIQISVDIKPETYIFADIEMLNIIVFNLISNAIKFTPQAGKVHVYTQKLEDIVMVSVEDNGIGISPENQAKLLQAKNFYTSGTAGESGFGLGLMICQDFISRNQGKFAFQSEVGKGSTFTIYLPNQPKTN